MRKKVVLDKYLSKQWLKSSQIWEANKIPINLQIKEAEETQNRINQRYPCQHHHNQTSQNKRQ